jgi:hypothetical protein
MMDARGKIGMMGGRGVVMKMVMLMMMVWGTDAPDGER